MNAGSVEILNVLEGDVKISFNAEDPEDIDKAKRIMQDMLKRGYCILIEVGKDDQGEALYRRAKAFDPATCEYVIAGEVDVSSIVGPPAAEPTVEAKDESAPSDSAPVDAPPRRRGRPRKDETRVPAAKTRAVGVAPRSGG